MSVLVSLYQIVAYYASFALFVVLSFTLNLAAVLASLLPPARRREVLFQHLVHRAFACFVRWLWVSGIVPVHYEGFERWPRRSGLVVVANHPSLMDIGFVLARVPEAVCIFKAAIGRNPLYNATARQAGYIASDGGHHLLRDAAAKVAAGSNLLIFPEGTRTRRREGELNPLKPGFVAIARLAAAPIQLIRITCDSTLLTKDGLPWWHVPRLPACITVSLGPCLPPPGPDTALVVGKIEGWFRGQRTVVRQPEAEAVHAHG